MFNGSFRGMGGKRHNKKNPAYAVIFFNILIAGQGGTLRDKRESEQLREKIPEANKEESRARSKLAEQFNTNPRYVEDARKYRKEDPEAFEAVKSGEKTLSKVRREKKQQEKEMAMQKAASKISKGASKKLSKVCDIRHCDMASLLADVKPDCVITDPPYPKEYIHLYKELAMAAKHIPKVIVMCGQTYFPTILSEMVQHLEYRWMLGYMTPGGQAVQVFPRKVNTFWKPILVFGKADEWIGDVCKSDVNDNDKQFHTWGQSESGMKDVVARLTKPNELICDPFLGGGTTAIASILLNRRFVGCDVDKKAVEKSNQRIKAVYQEKFGDNNETS